MIEDVAAPGTRGVSPTGPAGSGAGLPVRRHPAQPGPHRPGRWSLVLPLKGGPAAKSRLAAPPALATAIALDCLDAVLATRAVAEVIVVTSDPALAAAAAGTGALVRGETRPGSGLLAAIDDGLRGLDGPCAVLLGDLPALRPAELDLALETAWSALTQETGRPGAVFVPDADGVGTVLLAATGPTGLVPAFGPDSARRHAHSGARRLDLDLPTLRRDVDTGADLSAARILGLGPRTRAALPAPDPGRTGSAAPESS